MSDIKSVAILGGSGNLGEAVLSAFIKSHLTVTVISRPGSKATFPDGVKVVRASVDDPAGLTEALKGQDAVLSLVGNPGLPLQDKAIDAAVAAGVKWFVPSEFGHNTTDPRVLELLPVFSVKEKVIEHLKSKENDGLSWTSVITALFFDWCLPRDFLGFDLGAKTAQIWDGGDNPFSTINVNTIAKALVKLFTDLEAREKAKNQHVFISSFTTTQNEVLAGLEKITGEKWKVENVKSQDVYAAAREKLAKGEMAAMLDFIKGICVSGDKLCDFGDKAAPWNKILLPNNHDDLEETLEKVVKEGPKSIY